MVSWSTGVGWRNRTPKNCKVVVSGLLREREREREREERRETVVKHSVLMIEGLSDERPESHVMRILRRCHENLGHPSKAKVIAMLKTARATDRCLKLAKGLTCHACDQAERAKSHPVSRVESVRKFNQLVAMDTFEMQLPWRKLNLLNVVDCATRYQVVVPFWKGVDARRARVTYRTGHPSRCGPMEVMSLPRRSQMPSQPVAEWHGRAAWWCVEVGLSEGSIRCRAFGSSTLERQ